MPHGPARAARRRPRRPAGEQGDGARRRVGRRRQDDDRRRARARRRPSSRAARCSCSPSTRPAASPTRSASAPSATAPRRVPDAAFAAAGVEPRGELWAAMLDTKAGWDELIRRHAPDAEVRDAVLVEPALPEHHQPLRAQPRLPRDGAAARAARRRASTTSSSSTRRRRATPSTCSTRRRGWSSSSAAGCCAGSPCRTARACSRWRRSPSTRSPTGCSARGFLQDIAEFFVLFQAMEKGFVARAREVEALLGDPRTTFVVVSTLETAPAHEAAFLARELLARDYHLGAIVANRVLPRGAHAARRGDQRQAARRRGGRRRRSSPRSPTRLATAGPAATSAPCTTCSPRWRPASTTWRSSPRARPSDGPSWRRSRPGARRAVARLRRPRPRRPADAGRPPARELRPSIGQTRLPMASLAALVRDNTTLDRDQVSTSTA